MAKQNVIIMPVKIYVDERCWQWLVVGGGSVVPSMEKEERVEEVEIVGLGHFTIFALTQVFIFLPPIYWVLNRQRADSANRVVLF